MEDFALSCTKFILRFDIRYQYSLSPRDLIFYPKETGNNRIYFPIYTLSTDDSMEKEQGGPLLIHGDKLKAAICGSMARICNTEEQQGTELSSRITRKTVITREL